MMKTISKPKDVIIVGLIALVLLFAPLQLFASVTVAPDRIYGDDRIETALAVCDAGWPASADTVILAPANQENLIDALAASSLAGQEGAPILLTDKNSLDSRVKERIIELKFQKVYLVGAISDSVKSQVQALSGVQVTALKGVDRWETTKLINNELDNPAGSFIVGYDALPDALSVGSFAAKYHYAIILADAQGHIPAGQKALGSKTYLLGGPGLVANINGAERIYGDTRYETNAEFVKKFISSSGTINIHDNSPIVFVANGNTKHLVDSLVTAPYAARENAFIFLTDGSNIPKAAQHLSKGLNIKPVALGGPALVSDLIRDGVIPKNPSVAFEVTGVEAINLTDIRVVFSDQVNEEMAETVSNYIFDGRALVPGVDSAVLQGDRMTVIVTLAQAQPQYSAKSFEIKANSIANLAKDSYCSAFIKTLAFNTASGGTGVVGSPVIYDDGDNVKVEVTLSQSLMNFEPNDFVLTKLDGTGDIPADSGSVTQTRLTLLFTGSKAVTIRSWGPDVRVNANDTAGDGIKTTNIIGVPISEANPGLQVYDERIAPRWLGIAGVDAAGGTVTLEFSEAIDDSVEGYYLDDFLFQYGSIALSPDRVKVTGNTIEFAGFKAVDGTAMNSFISGETISVKAGENVQIRDLQDSGAQDWNVYLPTAADKGEGKSIIVP